MKPSSIILIISTFLSSFINAQTLKEMYDNANPGKNYEKLIVLDSNVVYTGGFTQDVQSVCIKGNGAIIDLSGEYIAVKGANNRLDIDHCVFIDSNDSIKPNSFGEPFLFFDDQAYGKIFNNTFYGLANNKQADKGINIRNCLSDTSVIINNIFYGFRTAVYYRTDDFDSYFLNKYLSVSNNLIFECEFPYLGWVDGPEIQRCLFLIRVTVNC